MNSHVKSGFALVILGLFAAGCQKLDVEKTYTIGVGDVEVLQIDGPSKQQKVTVTVTTTFPVNVHIVPESEHNAAMSALPLNKKLDPSQVLGSMEKMETGMSVEGTVPAKAGYSVIVSGATKKTEVTLKITGR